MYAPFSVKQGDDFTGFDVEVIKAVGERLGDAKRGFDERVGREFFVHNLRLLLDITSFQTTAKCLKVV